MAIVLSLDRLINNADIHSKELAQRVGINETNLSRIKTGKVKALRFSTLDGICRELHCRPGDWIDYVPDDEVDPSKHLVCYFPQN